MAAITAKATPPHLRMKANILTVASSPLSFYTSVTEDNTEDSSIHKFTPGTDGTGFLSSSPSPKPATDMYDLDTPAHTVVEKPDVVDDDDFGSAAEPEPRSPRLPSLGASLKAQLPKVKQPSPAFPRTLSRAGTRGAPGKSRGHPAVKHYDAEHLVGIGKQCSNRLPPASAIQAMFLYELQRETEAERLFHGQMFRLAKSEDEVAAQAHRFDEMESRMRKLEFQLAVQVAKDEKRLAASDSQLSTHQQDLFRCTGRLVEAEEKLVAIANQLNNVKELHEGAAVAAADAVKQAAQNAVSAATANAALATGNFDADVFNTMKAEIDVLFQDRDSIIGKISEVNHHIEYLVKGIHLLNSSNISPIIPEPAARVTSQRLPVTNGINGDLLDLSVSKANPLIPAKPRNPQEISRRRSGRSYRL